MTSNQDSCEGIFAPSVLPQQRHLVVSLNILDLLSLIKAAKNKLVFH